ncbi:M56 family metallopeptidase [Paludisphaera rhizosphaerae]|uniref:M56 family metallopeptidase n=1 Tax=Paludisphaera rhizosphaerae TaxID=2711216 RepID=UPI0013EAED3A|nr:M56 family metallopeptidase [Paludisphaera rhizosphaerae]
MWLVLDQFSRTLIDAAVANAILLSVVVVLVVFTRQPARRIVLAQTGVYAALLMIPLVVFDALPRSYPIDWMLRTGLVPPPLTPELSPLDVDLAGKPSPRGRSDSSSQAEWPAGERLVRVATLIYLVGAAAGLSWFGLGVWGFQRLLDRSVEVSPATQRVFDELIVDLERSPPHPALRASDWLRSPVLGGVIRPTIVIPGRLDRDEADPDALRLILLHELAHADRGDAWFNALAALAQILWFFLPHLWWLRTQLRIDQEFLADRRAAGPLGETTHYARWLVGLSSGRPAAVKTDGREVESPRFWRGRPFDTPLLQRVAMLLYCPFAVEGRPPRWFSVGVPAAFMLLAVALSMSRILAPVDPSALVPSPKAGDAIFRDLGLSEFEVAATEDNRSVVVFPPKLAIPPAFRLKVEVKASPRTLAQLRIAGCPLVPHTVPNVEDLPDEPLRWHHVEIRRQFGVFTVKIDDDEFEPDPKTVADARWLTFSPGDQPATVRNLQITW